MSSESEALIDRFVTTPVRIAFETKAQELNLNEAEKALRRSSLLGSFIVLVGCISAFGIVQFVGISEGQAVYQVTNAIGTLISIYVLSVPIIICVKIWRFKRETSGI